MTTKMDTFLDRLQTTNSVEDLQGLIASLRDIYDVEHAVYHSVGPDGKQYAALTYPDEWVDHYVDQQYQRVDPVVLGALQHFHPLDWKRLNWSQTPRQQFLGEALDVGIGNQGFSVPIRGPNGQFALFSVNNRCNDDRWAKMTDESTQDFLLLAHYVHQRAEEITTGALSEVTGELSPRERDVLTLLSLGLNRGQASDKLKISEHTFRVYVDTARHKLGAVNTTHAVAKALMRGVIRP